MSCLSIDRVSEPYLLSMLLHTPETSKDDTRMASLARGSPACCDGDVVDAMLLMMVRYSLPSLFQSVSICRLSVLLEERNAGVLMGRWLIWWRILLD